MNAALTLPAALSWVAGYVAVMLFYTLLDVAVWRRHFPRQAGALRIVTVASCAAIYLTLLRRAGVPLRVLENVTPGGLAAAVGCAALLYLMTDKGIDPLLEKKFPTSEQAYQESVQRLKQSPVSSFLQVCVIAPIVEELLMRGVVLGGLTGSCGVVPALLISSALFALLHFNMVQTLSALLCGLALGGLYLATGSVLCCIVCHGAYNVISFLTTIRPRDQAG